MNGGPSPWPFFLSLRLVVYISIFIYTHMGWSIYVQWRGGKPAEISIVASLYCIGGILFFKHLLCETYAKKKSRQKTICETYANLYFC